MQQRSRPPHGFTLVELLIAMAILALLMALSLPRYFGKLQESREAVLHEDLHVLRQALDRYLADRGRYPDSLQDLVAARYIDTVPIDPITGTREAWQLQASGDLDKPGIADVHSGAEGSSRDGVPYAAF